jgi:hypothetical protein
MNQHPYLMQPSKVQKTPQKPTVCPCGSTAHTPKSRGQNTFDAGVLLIRKHRYPTGIKPEKSLLITSFCDILNVSYFYVVYVNWSYYETSTMDQLSTGNQNSRL